MNGEAQYYTLLVLATCQSSAITALNLSPGTGAVALAFAV